MHPILAKIGPLYVYSYGLMVAIGFAAATILAYRNAPKFGLDKDRIVDVGIAALIGGIVGGRALYVLLNIKYYIANPAEVINITKGGLVWYGAFLFGIIAGIWFVKRHNINFWKCADLYAPYIALAQCFGRIGCFLNGCCYGTIVPSNFAAGVIFNGESVFRHPTQVYESAAMLLLFIILKKWQEKRHFNGEIFLGYALLYSLIRFFLEFFRGDNPKIVSGFTVSQLAGAGISAVCLTIFIYKFISWKKNSSRSA